MLNIKVSLDDRRLKRITQELRPGARRAVLTTAYEIERDVKARIQNPPKSGRIYLVSRGKGRRIRHIFHQASAPGQAPATDTGNLVNSIRVEPESDTSAWVVESAEYGAALEFGTPHIAKRPHMTPAAEAARPKFKARMEELFR